VSNPASDAAAERAQTLIELGRTDEAAAILNQALATEPEDAWLLDLLAQAQLESAPVQARETAQRLIAVTPESERGHLLLAIAAGELDSGREGEAHARAAVDRAPLSANAHAVLAQALVNRKRKLREARRHAERSIELAPEAALGYVTAGNVELRRGRGRKAERWYRRALEVDPTDRAAQVNMAITRNARGNLAHAFGDADAILRLNPNDESARRVLDNIVYTTLLHLQWVMLAAYLLAAILRGD
jgi:tetratricopeptide (TPR) repeat protein